MPTYIALIHEDDDGSYRVTFPDLPDIVTAGDDLDEAMEEAEEALEFAAESRNADGSTGLKPPRSVDQLRDDPDFIAASKDAIVIEVDLPGRASAAN
jgi:antitoxin HicB